MIQRVLTMTDWMARLSAIPLAMLLVSAGFVITWAFDRSPPFAILSVEPASARPGQWVNIRATVRRDIERGCSAEMSRWMVDSKGYRRDLEGLTQFSPDMLARMERQTPGRLYVSVKVPHSMPSGQAVLVSGLQYRCNPLHVLMPIFVVSELPFEVVR